jgi:hypothetical protein
MEGNTAFKAKYSFSDFRQKMLPANRSEKTSFTVRIKGLAFLDRNMIDSITAEARKELNITSTYDLEESRPELAEAIKSKIRNNFLPGCAPEFEVEIKYILNP